MRVTVSAEIPSIEKRSDSVDAIACVLAGQDFLSGLAFAPSNDTPAVKEVWIGVRRPDTQPNASSRRKEPRG